MNFKIWFENERYSTPDEFLNDPNSVSFIYAGNKLYYGSQRQGTVTHGDLVVNDLDLKQRYGIPPKMTNTEEVYNRLQYSQAFGTDLVGRVSVDVIEWEGKAKKRPVVAFWNEKSSDYKHFDGCIKELMGHGIIDNQAFVTSALVGSVPIEVARRKIGGVVDPEEARKLDLQRRLHMLTGAAKLDAMKQLGLGGGSKAPKSGIPGVKYWAPTSEWFNEGSWAYRNAKECPYWGDAGSGIIVIAKDTGKILLNHRGGGAVESGTYGVFGGGIFLHQVNMKSTEELMNSDIPKKHAIEELKEETSYSGPLENVHQIHMFKDSKVNRNGEPCNFYYWTFLGIAPSEFPIRAGHGFEDEEGGGSGWFTFEEAMKIQPKHPGLVDLFNHAGNKIRSVVNSVRGNNEVS